MNQNKKLKNQIKKINQQLVNKYGASKVILFGSAAWDPQKKPSDLDFLVIKSGADKIKQGRLLSLYELIEKEIAADFLVYTPKEYSTLLKMGDPLMKKIEKEGKVLHG